jgi:hypothetical protein
MKSPMYEKFKSAPYSYLLLNDNHVIVGHSNEHNTAYEYAKVLSLVWGTIHCFNKDNDEIAFSIRPESRKEL